MAKTFQRLSSALIVMVIFLMHPDQVFASANGSAPAGFAAGIVYYVSPAGTDANAGTSATAPFKTLAKAVSMLTAGSTLNILPGTYYERLVVKQSGTASAPITIMAKGAIINMAGAATSGIDLQGSYITVRYGEVTNSGAICVNVAGVNHITVYGLKVHGCTTHGIHVYRSSVVYITANTVYDTVLQNQSRTMAGGWASAIKVRESNYVLIYGNRVYHNYGEGMGTRATNIIIRANTVYDNFSVNIYTNSENATIDRNFVVCSTNSAYYRNGKPAGGIVMGEEYFSGWGARLSNARVINNIVSRCRNGIRYQGADSGVSGGGLKYAIIANNTLYDSLESTLSIVYGPAQTGNLIANNIIWQADNRLVSIDSGTGIKFQNNLWKVAPPPMARGAGDRYGTPRFALNPPVFLPTHYVPEGGSLAVDGGIDIGISTDYFARARPSPFDMGAIEFIP